MHSPRTEERLRQGGIWFLALSLPFVLCWMLLQLALIALAPNYMKRRASKRQELLSQIGQWLDTELSRYRAMSFAEIGDLPTRTEVMPPLEFRAHRFVLTRAAGDNGGVEIRISLRKKQLFFFEFLSGPSFEMLADGSIVSEVSYEPED